MTPWLLYIIGCIGFAPAIVGGLGLYATLVSDFEVSGVGVAPRKGFEVSEVGDYVKPAFLLAAGIAAFAAGWPS